ncbi:MAG: GNAT family N-acetyltransferase [Actinomycetota bacterium]|nr:GNAT family N-acetyltransferase [Actinomycetota bacterium]
MGDGDEVEIRRATPRDARATADVYLASRAANLGSIPLGPHGDDNVRVWFAETLMNEADIRIGIVDDVIIGFLALKPGWLDHLYLAPGATGRGLGARFVDLAKREQPTGLDLWTFQSNTGARAFYRRQGFVEVAHTDGDNEEGEPDVRCAWRPEI